MKIIHLLNDTTKLTIYFYFCIWKQVISKNKEIKSYTEYYSLFPKI